MKISIIIPVYKVEDYIADCLRSVFAQTYKGEIECILVDDCGCDDSMRIAEQFISRYDGAIQFVLLHHDHNRGLSAARNTGMEAAHGDYIYFLDSDDDISPDCIEKLAIPLKKESYDLVVGNIRTIGDPKLHDFLKLKIDDGVVLRGKSIQETYRRKWNMMAQNKLYRKTFLTGERLNFKESLIHEDELWSIQVAALAKTMTVVNDYTYNYYIRKGGITAQSTSMKKAAAIEIVVYEACKFLRERHIFSGSLYKVIFSHINKVLGSFLDEKPLFLKAYMHMKDNPYLPFWIYFRTYGFHILAQLYNLYNLLPAQIGANYLYNRMVKRAKRRKCKTTEK